MLVVVTMKSSAKPLFNEEESSAPDELATVIVEDENDEVVSPELPKFDAGGKSDEERAGGKSASFIRTGGRGGARPVTVIIECPEPEFCSYGGLNRPEDEDG